MSGQQKRQCSLCKKININHDDAHKMCKECRLKKKLQKQKVKESSSKSESTPLQIIVPEEKVVCNQIVMQSQPMVTNQSRQEASQQLSKSREDVKTQSQSVTAEQTAVKRKVVSKTTTKKNTIKNADGSVTVIKEVEEEKATDSLTLTQKEQQKQVLKNKIYAHVNQKWKTLAEPLKAKSDQMLLEMQQEIASLSIPKRDSDMDCLLLLDSKFAKEHNKKVNGKFVYDDVHLRSSVWGQVKDTYSKVTGIVSPMLHPDCFDILYMGSDKEIKIDLNTINQTTYANNFFHERTSPLSVYRSSVPFDDENLIYKIINPSEIDKMYETEISRLEDKLILGTFLTFFFYNYQHLKNRTCKVNLENLQINNIYKTYEYCVNSNTSPRATIYGWLCDESDKADYLRMCPKALVKDLTPKIDDGDDPEKPKTWISLSCNFRLDFPKLSLSAYRQFENIRIPIRYLNSNGMITPLKAKFESAPTMAQNYICEYIDQVGERMTEHKSNTLTLELEEVNKELIEYQYDDSLTDRDRKKQAKLIKQKEELMCKIEDLEESEGYKKRQRIDIDNYDDMY